MDSNHGFGVWDQANIKHSVEMRVRKVIEDLKGTVETLDVQQITDGGSQEQTATREDGSHRVCLSFVVPSSVTAMNERETLRGPRPAISAVAPVRTSSSSLGDILGIADMIPEKDSDHELIWGDIMKDFDSKDLNEALSDEELAQILNSYMDNDDLENYINQTDEESITVKNEEILHAAIDKHLSQTSVTEKSKESEWKSPLFNNLEGDESKDSTPSETQPESVEMEDLSEEEEEDKMEVLNSDKQNLMPAGLQLQENRVTQSSTCSFSTLTTMPGSGPPNPQPIRQQVTLPMYALNQVTYALTTSSQNQILHPANLPAVSALINGGRGPQSLNWAIARYTAGAPATIVSVKPQPARGLIPPSRPSVLISRIPGTFQSTSQMSSSQTVVTRVRCRKNNHLFVKECKDSLAAETHKQELVTQFADLQRSDKVPDGHSFESWILQEGLHNIRKQGLHRNQGSDYYPFKCPLCDKMYRNPNGIKYHAKYGHGPKCVFTCPICQRDYATRHGLSAHKRSHQCSAEGARLESTGQGKSMQKVNTIIIQTQAAPRPA